MKNKINVRDFVTEAFDYLTNLETCSIDRSVNRYLLEYIANGFAKYGATVDDFIDNVDDFNWHVSSVDIVEFEVEFIHPYLAHLIRICLGVVFHFFLDYTGHSKVNRFFRTIGIYASLFVEMSELSCIVCQLQYEFFSRRDFLFWIFRRQATAAHPNIRDDKLASTFVFHFKGGGHRLVVFHFSAIDSLVDNLEFLGREG